VFLPASDLDRALAVLAPRGVEPPTAGVRRAFERDEQVRPFWDRAPLDLFFSYNELHEACVERKQRLPFGADRISMLSPEDLAIFKVLFDCEKDWRDLGEVHFAQASKFGAADVLGWLERIVAPDDERLARIRTVHAAPAAR